jgi:hypothetical protein
MFQQMGQSGLFRPFVCGSGFHPELKSGQKRRIIALDDYPKTVREQEGFGRMR